MAILVFPKNPVFDPALQKPSVILAGAFFISMTDPALPSDFPGSPYNFLISSISLYMAFEGRYLAEPYYPFDVIEGGSRTFVGFLEERGPFDSPFPGKSPSGKVGLPLNSSARGSFRAGY